MVNKYGQNGLFVIKRDMADEPVYPFNSRQVKTQLEEYLSSAGNETNNPIITNPPYTPPAKTLNIQQSPKPNNNSINFDLLKKEVKNPPKQNNTLSNKLLPYNQKTLYGIKSRSSYNRSTYNRPNHLYMKAGNIHTKARKSQIAIEGIRNNARNPFTQNEIIEAIQRLTATHNGCEKKNLFGWPRSKYTQNRNQSLAKAVKHLERKREEDMQNDSYIEDIAGNGYERHTKNRFAAYSFNLQPKTTELNYVLTKEEKLAYNKIMTSIYNTDPLIYNTDPLSIDTDKSRYRSNSRIHERKKQKEKFRIFTHPFTRSFTHSFTDQESNGNITPPNDNANSDKSIEGKSNEGKSIESKGNECKSNEGNSYITEDEGNRDIIEDGCNSNYVTEDINITEDGVIGNRGKWMGDEGEMGRLELIRAHEGTFLPIYDLFKTFGINLNPIISKLKSLPQKISYDNFIDITSHINSIFDKQYEGLVCDVKFNSNKTGTHHYQIAGEFESGDWLFVNIEIGKLLVVLEMKLDHYGRWSVKIIRGKYGSDIDFTSLLKDFNALKRCNYPMYDDYITSPNGAFKVKIDE